MDGSNGSDAPLEPAAVEERRLVIELTLEEARALKSWLLKPAADGSAAIDNEVLKSAVLQLDHALGFVELVAAVREELAQAGFATDDMSDEEVAALGRRIASSSRRLPGSH